MDEWEREIGCTASEYRVNYSKTPIPSMLHACVESRNVALGWYQLALQPVLAEPRIYFDFSADYIYAGCDGCFSHLAHDCTMSINFQDRKKISKILCRWPWENDPFFVLYMYFRGVKEILLFDAPAAGLVPSDMQLHNLKEGTSLFSWQEEGKKLHDIFLAQKEELDSFVDVANKHIDEENARRSTDPDYPSCCLIFPEMYFRPEKIARVEMDFKPDLPVGLNIITVNNTPSTAVGANL